MSHQTPYPATYKCPHIYVKEIPPHSPEYTFSCHHCCLSQDYGYAVRRIRRHFAPEMEKLNKNIHDIVLQLTIHRDKPLSRELRRQMGRQLQRYEEQLERVEKEKRRREKVLKDCVDKVGDIKRDFDKIIREKKVLMREVEDLLLDEYRPERERRFSRYQDEVEGLKDKKKEKIKRAKQELCIAW